MQTVEFQTLQTFDQDLVELARRRRRSAYAPYSNFKVGAAISVQRFRDGSIARGLAEGCNVENVFFEVTHAESAAISDMIEKYSNGDRFIPIIEAIAVALEAPEPEQHALPCGFCRQWLREFGTPETRILGAKLNRFGDVVAVEVTTLGELLPFDFGPQNLTR